MIIDENDILEWMINQMKACNAYDDSILLDIPLLTLRYYQLQQYEDYIIFLIIICFLWIGAQLPQEIFISSGRILTLLYYFIILSHITSSSCMDLR